MKQLTINISDAAYKKLRSEVMTYELCHSGEGSLMSRFLSRCFQEWDENQIPEFKTKKERENEQA